MRLKTLLFILLLPLFAYPQAVKKHRQLYVDSINALNGGIIDVKDSASFEKPVGIGGTLDASAILTLTDTTQGILIPKLTTVQRDVVASPTVGLLIFNTTTNQLEYFADMLGWLGVGFTGGDMLKSAYDSNNDSIVNNADTLNGDIDASQIVGLSAGDSSFVVLQTDTFKAFNNTNIQVVDSTIHQEHLQADKSFTVNLGLSTLKGIDATSGNFALKVQDNVGTELFNVRNDGNVGIGLSTPLARVHIKAENDNGTTFGLKIDNSALDSLFYLRDDGIFALGENALASGTGEPFALGNNAKSTGRNAIAIGSGALAGPANECLAIGVTSLASGLDAIAVGNIAQATGLTSIAIGHDITSGGISSIGIGTEVIASGRNAIAIGPSASVPGGNESMAIGIGASTVGNNAMAIGFSMKASAQGSIALGIHSATVENNVSNSLMLAFQSVTPSFLFAKTVDSYLNGSGNVGIGLNTGISARLLVKGINTSIDTFALKIQDSSGVDLFSVENNGDVIAHKTFNYFTDTSSVNDTYGAIEPLITAYTTGMSFYVNVGVANTGAATFQFNALAPLTIKKLHDQDLITGDVEAGQILHLIYDGTNLQMLSQLAQ
ncbi:hypothetical protein LCGC14_0770910 [marine sediment metagenome]|uniref:Trimeric autotransporter adhesin YadA-like head domain-containing protein n=1 Tax=marine sediment metagenome TaxID=412755 RepID=A0A0F9T583_9ZZZZ